MNIYITLDYELYNGLQSGSVQNCLITPTNELLKILNKHQIKAVFFIDVCYLLRLRHLSTDYVELKNDYTLLESQIRMLSEQGHDIQLHIHPNWYRARYSNGNWKSEMDDYKLSDLPVSVVNEIFKAGIQLLKSITGKDVIAFRAGAYCIQTYKDYINLFRQHNIIIDSSVNRNKVAKTEKWEWYDYRDIPNEYSYSFSNDVCKQDIFGPFMEYSIPNYKVTRWALYKKDKKLNKEDESMRSWGDGKPSVGGALYKGLKKYWVKLLYRLSPIYIPASIDGTNAYFLEDFFQKEYVNGGYMMIMGHPKCLTPYSLMMLDKFICKHKSVLCNKTLINNS